jgi:hypothetical protein
VFAQSFYSIRRERDVIATIGSGASTYFGELKNPGENFAETKFNINVGLQYYFNNRVSGRAELTWFKLAGDDAKADDQSRVNRNLSFSSNNLELSATGAVNLFPMGQRFYQRPNINFYGFAGVALLYINPKAEYQGKKYALQPLETEDVKYSRVQFAIPYGIGARLKVGPFMNLAIEGGWRLTFTDYLDDVSTVHPDKSSWTDPIRVALSDRRQEGNPSLSPYAPGTQRGNPDKNDQYFLLNVKVEIYLPSSVFSGNSQRKLYNRKRRAIYRRR